MRKTNTEIVPLIKKKALELLMKRNPDAIGMRDIARECSITAANIYHYYADKDKLFQEISLDCLHDAVSVQRHLRADERSVRHAAGNPFKCGLCGEAAHCRSRNERRGQADVPPGAPGEKMRGSACSESRRFSPVLTGSLSPAVWIFAEGKRGRDWSTCRRQSRNEVEG